MSWLQKKPPAHKRGHPTLQNMNFFYFCGSFLPSWIRIRIRIQITDPDPDPMVRLNTDPIRIRIRIRNPGWQWAASQTSGTSSRPLTGISRQRRPRRTMQVSQGWYRGRQVAVGSLKDLWHKLQASNRDKQAEEAKADNAGESRAV